MSLYSSITNLGYWGPIADVVAPASTDTKVKPNEQLERPQVYTGLGSLGFDKAPAPSFSTYWRMRGYSACVLAYSVMVAPVFAGTRTATVRNADGTEAATSGTPTGIGAQVTQTPEEKRRKALDDLFEDLWPDVLCGLEGYNFGAWTQETIWGRKAGTIAPVRFKSFLPPEIQIQRDKYNDFAGFKHGQSTRGAEYAFHFVCQPHFDPIFGVPRAENAREAWHRAMESQANGDKIERKASGRQMRLQFPTGSTWKDADGNAVITATAVQTIVNAAASGAVWTEPIPWRKEDVKANPDLLKTPLITAQAFDWGDTGPSLLAAIARLDRLDKEIVRAWSRPEREAMEGQHGTKAEAGTHGAIGTLDSEKVHSDFLRQLNKQVVDRWLVTNFGPETAGTIYFKPAPLADPQQQFKQAVATALLNSPTQGPQLSANVDGRRLLKETELPLVPEGSVPVAAPVEPPDGSENDLSVGDDDERIGK
jgi:hypothetical protein